MRKRLLKGPLYCWLAESTCAISSLLACSILGTCIDPSEQRIIRLCLPVSQRRGISPGRHIIEKQAGRFTMSGDQIIESGHPSIDHAKYEGIPGKG
jgi:hypothetical protein